MCFHETVDITSYITAIAAIIGVVIAGFGLKAWRKQLRGTTEYDLAKRLMLLVYQLRDALQSARNPFVSVSEGSKDDTEDTWEITAYSKRWDQVVDLIPQFNVTSLEAEVVWDDMLKTDKQNLLKLVSELSFAITMFIRQKKDKSFTDDFNKISRDTLYRQDDDKFSKSLEAVVKGYEKKLKSHLKR